MNRAEWERGRVEAEMWWCGDEYCDCIQPQINRVTPNREAGYPFVRYELLWEGEFVSRGESGYPDGVTYQSLIEDLREAFKAHEGAVWLVAE